MRSWRQVLKNEGGQTLVELLVVIGITAIMLPALATAIVASSEGRGQEEERVQATALLREADEATRSVREKGWSNVATNGTYHPIVSGSAWSLAASAETIGEFTRQVVISDVQRNTSGAIVASGGTVDPSSKQAVITVSWSSPIASSVSSTTYLQRYLGNTAWNQTTQADFNAGTKTNTTVTNTSGGEVQLAAGGSVSWASPTIAGSYDVPSSTADANDVYVDAATSRAYLAVGTTLKIMNIANPASPALLGSYTATGVVNSVYVSGNYAYLATASDTAELTVVNVTTPASPTTAGTLDLTSTTDATSIFVSGTNAYIGRLASGTAGVNEFYVVSVATPTAPSLTGSLNLPNNVNGVYVSGTVAYLATANSSGELTVVNVATPASPAQLGLYNAAGTSSVGTDVFAVGTTVYFTMNNNTSGPEFFIINAATPASPTLTGSYEVGANVNGVYVSGTNAFLATALASKQFMVLDLTTPATPVLTGSTNLNIAVNDLSFSGSNAYIASQSDTFELTVMQGTSSGYQASGTYESPSFDAAATVGYNYLSFTVTKPASTNVQFQIATNADNATWSYVGPDGTAGTFYTSPAAIPLAKVSGRYFRYKATLTGPATSTPTLSDTSVNYAP